MKQIIVIGAGQAGASLVAKLRGLGCRDAITLIGSEAVPPYQRPPLSKAYLLGEMPAERLYLRPADYYAEHDITLRLGETVTAIDTGIDTGAQTVSLGGDVLRYDALVLTTGSTPRRLPASIGGALGGVFTLRDLSDVDAMRPYFTPGKRVVIVGGGYIGLEGAAVAAKLGLDVTVLEMAPRILQRVAAPETSAFFRKLHSDHGVKILESTGLDRLLGEGHVTAARLSDGREIPADFVIVGVGITPATGLAEAAGIALDNGIKTDAQGRTSAPNVWAAGDCASFPTPGGQMRLESVPNAIDQAEVVAANLLGAEKPYIPEPWFWSDQFDIKLQIAGLNSGYDHIVTRQTEGATSFWYYKGATLLAVDAMNDPRAFMVAKRLLAMGKSPAPEAVSNPETDLKVLLK
ncbi:pyridine nucleotide-disulfide oxidoreductase [Pseudorhodobacter sp. E13]|uniref:NAD(P)/FAD-dependent oxidoreductase n=1 Tax=Pseudorhodobacter sp. E13 TaxID=2487931 RepID=UPI000F8D689D|nr:FAD-dependent oxidoreductase [Pseudorhodobacter sp. E13]RUS58814.1 pyridine nucleotide-disulfide oxidoreductase [Pseudorhodobacter sp. E13]